MIVDQAAAVIKKDFLTAVRHRNGVLLHVVSPATQLVTFYYLARAVGSQFKPDGMPYFLFLLIGTGFYTFLLTGMHSFLRTIQEAQQSGTLEVLMTTATSPAALLSLGALSACAGGLVQMLIYVGAGLWLLHAAIRISLAAGIAVFLFSWVIAISIGILAAGLQIATHKGSALLWLLGSTAWLMAGTLFPISTLPESVRMLSQLLPLTHALNGMRLAIVGSSSQWLLGREIGALLLFSVLLLPLSIAFFSWTVRRARQLGTLSFY